MRAPLTADRTAFDTYRRSAGEKATVPRLALGTAIIVVCWALSSILAIVGGVFLVARLGSGGAMPDMAAFTATPAGVLTVLASFCGIWIGAWIAMRLVHGETLSALFGGSRRLSWNGFAKGLVAVLLTSLLSEVLIYPLQPAIARGTIGVAAWLVALVPIAAPTFVQTSSEELLFRGYLPRGLARRFKSPIAWALLPTAAFKNGAAPTPGRARRSSAGSADSLTSAARRSPVSSPSKWASLSTRPRARSRRRSTSMTGSLTRPVASTAR